MNKNSENPSVGKNFQDLSAKLIKEHFGKKFNQEVALDIRNPSRAHKFDLVSEDNSIVAECKCYTWTEGKNNPSAKMATLNEAVLYFKLLPDTWKKVIVMKKSEHPKRGEMLADYYLRRYNFLLDGIMIIEIDEDAKKIKIVKE